MKWFTVEVTLESVENDDWSQHLRAIDAVPGTLLIQDAGAPVLSFPVEASEPLKAARFVEGVLSIVGLGAVSGEITDMPDRDFEMDEDDTPSEQAGTSPVVQAVRDWMDGSPAPKQSEDRELLRS